MTAQVEDADAWFCNLEDVANRVTANERRARQNRRRISVLGVFVLAAFMLLAVRQENNIREIQQTERALGVEQERLAVTRRDSCLAGVIIVSKYNRLQDMLTAIEREDTTTSNPSRRDDRIAAYEAARILPLPNCP